MTIRDPAATAATCRHRPEPTADIGVACGAEPSVRLDGCVMTCVHGYSLGQSSFPARNVLSAACPSLTPLPAEPGYHRPFHRSIVSPFRERHIAGDPQEVAFAD